MTKTDAEAGMGWTPGPWTVVPYGDGYSLTIHSDADNRVCFMATPGSRGSWDRIQADARLIAAAPELADALRALDMAAVWFVAESATWANHDDQETLTLVSHKAASNFAIKVGALREIVHASARARAALAKLEAER